MIPSSTAPIGNKEASGAMWSLLPVLKLVGFTLQASRWITETEVDAADTTSFESAKPDAALRC